MSTWLEVRQEILTLLDVDKEASTDDDIRSLVDVRMKRQRDKLIQLRPPFSLLTESDVVDVTNLTSFIPLGANEDNDDTPPVSQTGFGLTDFWRFFALTIDSRDVPYTPWKSWICGYSMELGNQRDLRTWTLSPADRIYLGWLPSTDTETWEAKLHYYKEAATIADGGTCEIVDEHLDTLVLGVVLKFPNLFQGEERTIVFAGLKKDHDTAMRDYLADKGQKGTRKSLRMRPAARRRGVDNSYLSWGDPTSI
jgi:hypothetical protein